MIYTWLLNTKEEKGLQGFIQILFGVYLGNLDKKG